LFQVKKLHILFYFDKRGGYRSFDIVHIRVHFLVLMLSQFFIVFTFFTVLLLRLTKRIRDKRFWWIKLYLVNFSTIYFYAWSAFSSVPNAIFLNRGSIKVALAAVFLFSIHSKCLSITSTSVFFNYFAMSVLRKLYILINFVSHELRGEPGLECWKVTVFCEQISWSRSF